MHLNDLHDDDEENEAAIEGYCHFNEDGSNIAFSIDIFGITNLYTTSGIYINIYMYLPQALVFQ